MSAGASVRLVLPLVVFVSIVASPVASRAQVPISTVPGDALDQQAVGYPNAFGVGALSLVWRQYGQDFSDPVTLKWGLFSVASALNDVLPVDGATIAPPSRSLDQIHLAPTGSLGCPVGGFCPSEVVAYTQFATPHNQVRVLRFGDASGGWNMAATASAALQEDPRIASDGGAGAVVSWIDVTGVSADTTRPRAQRLGGDGTRLWGPEGVLVAPDVMTTELRLAGDGAGGAYFVWTDARFEGEGAIFAMHLDGNGAAVAGWPADGLLIRRGPNLPQLPGILADGAGGVYLMWSEFESTTGGLALQPRIVRVHPDGTRFAGWLADGNLVAPLADSPVYVSDLEPDGAGGVLAACTHITALGRGRAMVQRLKGDGSRPAGWPASGLDGAEAAGDQLQPAVVGQSGAAVLVWSDARNGDFEADIYGARFLADGSRAPGWPATGLPIATAPGIQRLPVIGTGAVDNVLVAWTDIQTANGSGWDLWGTILTGDGHVVSVPTRMGGQPAFAITSANPSRGAIRGTFTLAVPGRVRLEVHDVAGRFVGRLLDGEAEAGRNAFAWDARDASGALLPAGVYFVNLRSVEGSRTRTVVIAR